jgi:hypothetical protein
MAVEIAIRSDMRAPAFGTDRAELYSAAHEMAHWADNNSLACSSSASTMQRAVASSAGWNRKGWGDCFVEPSTFFDAQRGVASGDECQTRTDRCGSVVCWSRLRLRTLLAYSVSALAVGLSGRGSDLSEKVVAWPTQLSSRQPE